MKGSREIIEMEENGEIELIETTPNRDMGWVYTRVHHNNLVSITEHEYVPTNWQEIQTKDLKEMKNGNN